MHPCKISLLKGDESCRDDVDVTGDSRRIVSMVKLNRFVITKISNSFHVFIYQEFKLHNIISPQLLFFLDNFTSSPATRTIHSHDCIETKVDLNKTYKNQPSNDISRATERQPVMLLKRYTVNSDKRVHAQYDCAIRCGF